MVRRLKFEAKQDATSYPLANDLSADYGKVLDNVPHDLGLVLPLNYTFLPMKLCPGKRRHFDGEATTTRLSPAIPASERGRASCVSPVATAEAQERLRPLL